VGTGNQAAAACQLRMLGVRHPPTKSEPNIEQADIRETGISQGCLLLFRYAPALLEDPQSGALSLFLPVLASVTITSSSVRHHPRSFPLRNSSALHSSHQIR
jgi:hypothetical protein